MYMLIGMKTVKNDQKTLILVLVSFYNNGTKTKSLGSVYGIEITCHSKTKKSKRRYVENDRHMKLESVTNKNKQ
jgi:hypothetical protein